MQIERKLIKEQTIEAFADEHNLIMEVHERDDGFDKRMKFYAHFKRVETIDGCILCGMHGNGSNEDEAIKDYARAISCKRIVFNASGEGRKEINCPRFIRK